jgi:hypothetical protein
MLKVSMETEELLFKLKQNSRELERWEKRNNKLFRKLDKQFTSLMKKFLK